MAKMISMRTQAEADKEGDWEGEGAGKLCVIVALFVPALLANADN